MYYILEIIYMIYMIYDYIMYINLNNAPNKKYFFFKLRRTKKLRKKY
jgi:hypothetical protein